MSVVSDGAATAKRERLSDTVFQHLRDEILSGRLAPGERIHDSEVAQSLGVSAMPVREALHRLERLGLVETMASRYTRVSVPDPDSFDDAMDFLACQVKIAVALAIPRMSADERERIASLLSRAAESCETEAPTPSDIYAASFEAVEAIGRATRNPIFLMSFRTAWFALQRGLRGTHRLRNSPRYIADRFRELRDAALAGDLPLAERAAWLLLRDEPALS